MKKLSRVLVVLLAAVAGLIAILLLGVNIYVQSKGTQARIQQELSQRLGTPLRIRQISVTPWFGLKLNGITIPQTESAVSTNFLEAKTFRLRIQLASLFTRRLVIKEVSLVNPTVVWAQNSSGTWRLPGFNAEAAPAAAPPPPPKIAEPAPPSGPASVAGGAPAVSATAPAVAGRPAENDESEPPFTPEIRKVNLAGGNFRFLDRNGTAVATFGGVNFRSSFRSAAALQGFASIAKTSLHDRFFLEDLNSPIRYETTELDFSKISARAAAGEITGRFTMLTQEHASPFTASVVFRDLQADRIVSDAGGPHGVVKGRLEGKLDANGSTADPDAFAGAGEIYLRDGVVEQYALLSAAGDLLQIDELKHLHLDRAELKFHITPGVVMIDQLLLHSPNIRLTAKGTVSFAGKLRLDSQLAVSEKIRAQLFRLVRDNFRPADEAGFGAVDFTVSGTLDRPKTNLMEKLVGRDLHDLGSVIGSFLGGNGDKAQRKKERKAREDAAKPEAPDSATTPNESITPAPSPAP